MKQHTAQSVHDGLRTSSGRSLVGPAGLAGLAGAILALAGLSACAGGDSAPTSGSGSPGTLQPHPDASGNTSKTYVVDPNRRGEAPEVFITGLFWGRLVDVFDASGTLQNRDYVIGDDVKTDHIDYVLDINPVTAKQTLTILHDAETEPAEYKEAFFALDQNLVPISDQPPSGSGIYTMVPRNAAIVVQFDDLIDPELVNADTIRVLTGSPPVEVFKPRIVVDANHGDLAQFTGDTGPTFYPTRAIIDTTVSPLESFEFEPPLEINGVGLPASVAPNLRNVDVRIPTVENAAIGQEEILRNPTDHELATSGNGTVDFGSTTVDVLRTMRSGGDELVTGDPFNGFLRDEMPPDVVGRQPISIDAQPVPDTSNPDNDERDFIIPQMHFLSEFCAQTPDVGDVIQQFGVFVQVSETPAPQVDGVLQDVKVRLLLGEPDEWVSSALGAAQFLSIYEPAEDEGREVCFVQISPTPSGFPENPAEGLSTNSIMGVRFSEPMDPASMTAFDSLTLTRVPEPTATDQYVVGVVDQSPDLQRFEFIPDLPLAHQVGMSESYYLTLEAGDLGPSDLAGNALAFALPQIEATIDPTQQTQSNGGRVSRFTGPDEEEPFGDETGIKPEWGGQHLYDVVRELIRPRPLVRFDAVADRTQSVPSLQTPFPPGVQTPLSSLGSKMQTVWRYADVGFSLTDTTNYNVDIEGMSWAPIGGQVIADSYSQFQISLAHSLYLPDEYIDPQTLFPKFPQSGLKKVFSTNVLDPTNDPFDIVHPKERGYVVNPGDLFATSTGTLAMPYPMNRNAEGDLPVSEFNFYTWRDTSLLARGGAQSGGAEIFQNCKVLGIGNCGLMSPGNVQTIGLPILMEFRCYPDDEALGLNAFDISLAANSSARPDFRAFSTGGTNQAAQTIRVEPDLETEANGGFNPNSNPPGATTYGLDNSFYIGSMDMVTRLSRSFSVWFEATGISGDPQYNPPVLEPRAQDQPVGTDGEPLEVRLAFRGATVAEPADVREDANTLDGYGDHYTNPTTSRNSPNPQINFLNGDFDWFDDISEISGAPFYQIRITFFSNPETGISPELSALGLTWQE